jgi:16S rRNA processing protein RimM
VAANRPEARVCVGVITGARGLKGEVRVKSFTARPADVGAYGPLSDEAGGRTLDLTVTGPAKDHVIARIGGVADRTAAEALKGTRLYVARAALPEPAEEEYYHADLIGLRVEAADGQGPAAWGAVKAVHDFGGGAMLEIERPDGAAVMLPFTRLAVPVVDIAGGRIVVAPPAETTAEAEGTGP